MYSNYALCVHVQDYRNLIILRRIKEVKVIKWLWHKSLHIGALVYLAAAGIMAFMLDKYETGAPMTIDKLTILCGGCYFLLFGTILFFGAVLTDRLDKHAKHIKALEDK
jgi:hypothetical protein